MIVEKCHKNVAKFLTHHLLWTEEWQKILVWVSLTIWWKYWGAGEKNAAKVTEILIFYEKCYSNYLVCRAGISEKQPRTNSCMLFLLQKDRNLMLLAITSTSGRVKMSMGPKTFIDKDTWIKRISFCFPFWVICTVVFFLFLLIIGRNIQM